jgi:hypothetical protein
MSDWQKPEAYGWLLWEFRRDLKRAFGIAVRRYLTSRVHVTERFRHHGIHVRQTKPE